MDRLPDDQVKDGLRKFIEDKRMDDVNVIADNYPDEQSLIVDYKELLNYYMDRDIQEDGTEEKLNSSYIMSNAQQCIDLAEEAIKDILKEHGRDEDIELNFRIEGIPAARRKMIRDLRAEDLGEYVSVKGLVRKSSKVRPKIDKAMYRCTACGGYQKMDQNMYSEGLDTPLECADCGKSKNKTNFILLRDQSDFDNYQTLEVQESPEELRGGKKPERIRGRTKHDIVDMVSPGDRVILNGILKSTPRGNSREKSRVFDMYLDVRSIEVEEHEFEELNLTDEDKKEIRRVARRGDVLELITKSIAPTLRGLLMEKRGIALQLFSGIRKEMPDGTITRGDVHILLVGDPGTGKSQLLRYASNLAPRGMFASGKGSTGAGLTAAAKKEKVMGQQQWILEAGTLVLADGGVACVDELDKMDSKDRSAMHEAMEQQSVSIAKAGINTTLNTRCAVLGAANPELGRFQIHENLSQQIDLPPPLLSRFDLIFALIDQPNEDDDEKIGRHILDMHTKGGKRERGEEYEDDTDTILSKDFLKKYIAYAKRKKPLMQEEPYEKILDFYVELRNSTDSEDAIPVTARQMESLIRLSEASARAHLRDKITEKDAEIAITITKYFLNEIVATENGVLDIDMVSSKFTQDQRTAQEVIRDVIRAKMDEVEEYQTEGVPKETILELATKRDYSETEIENQLDRMRSEGMVYSPSTDMYKFT